MPKAAAAALGLLSSERGQKATRLLLRLKLI